MTALAKRIAPALERRERERAASSSPAPWSAQRYHLEREARDARIAALRAGTVGRPH